MSGDHGHAAGVYDDSDAVRAVVVSAVVLGLAAAVELGAARAAGSAAVLADALHNLGDVLTTAVLLAGFRLARRPATRRFNSGFGRIEDVATLLIVFVIVATASVALYESVVRLLSPQVPHAAGLGLLATGFGAAANLGVSIYKTRVGRGLGSPALIADGIHSRIDALVSVAAMVGLGLAAAGLGLADPVAGIAITAMIVWALAGTVRDLFLRMMDAVDPHLVDDLAHAALHVDGVLDVSDVRVRWVGRELVAILHVAADGDLSLREAHAVAERVEREVARHLPNARADIHMDAAGDHHHHRGGVGDAEAGD